MPASSALLQPLVCLKRIEDLLSEQFLVPEYQRGYRWKDQQVQQLLEDLTDFGQRAQKGRQYCLQPVVVQRLVDCAFELIDGQQRLTTIYLVLQCMGHQKGSGRKRLFRLNYATRPRSHAFLEQPDNDTGDDNIDFFHLRAAYQFISRWLDKRGNTAVTALRKILLHRTCVIWYEVLPTDRPHEIFTRLNSGKIPLTNAELIKALFLRNDEQCVNPDELRRRQQEIAAEWDTIEGALQRDAFWFCLEREMPPPGGSRIGWLLANIVGTSWRGGTDDGETFAHFSKRLAEADTATVSAEWQRVQDRFSLFEEWFEDWELYHQIGYLRAVGEPLGALVREAESNKPTFQAELCRRIRAKLPVDLDISLDELRYEAEGNGGDNDAVRKVLLYFNVATVQQSPEAGLRFPFHSYHGQGTTARRWSLEHIHPQADMGLLSPSARAAWLDEMEKLVASAPPPPIEPGATTLVTPAQVLTAIEVSRNTSTDEAFWNAQEQAFGLFGAPDPHALSNLALLTSEVNSALGNGPFPQKRQRILGLEQAGAYVPLATRNVFLKYYSPAADHLYYWTKADRDAYLATIKKTLAHDLSAVALS